MKKFPVFFLFLFAFSLISVQAFADFYLDPGEEETYNSLFKQKYIEARTQAEQRVKANPNAAVSWLTLAFIENYSEGRFARAYSYVKKAEQILKGFCGDSYIAEPNCVRWYAETLYQKMVILEDLNEIKKALDVLNHYNTLFKPKMSPVWLYIKLQRLDEAADEVNKLFADKSNYYDADLSARWNFSCIVAAEIGERSITTQKCYEAEQQFPDSMVLHYNSAISSISAFSFERAEQSLRKAMNSIADFDGFPSLMLGELFLIEGRLNEALTMAKDTADMYRKMDGFAREGVRFEYYRHMTHLLLLMGQAANATEFAEKVGNSHIRAGSTSTDHRLINALRIGFYLNALRFEQALLPYQRAHQSFKESLATRLHSLKLTWKIYKTRRQFLDLVLSGISLKRIIRVYDSGIGISLYIPTWMMPEIIQAIGVDFFRDIKNKLFATETDFKNNLEGFDSAYEALISLVSDDEETTNKMADVALEKLPPSEALLKTYLLTMKAAYLQESGSLTARIEALNKLWNWPVFIPLFQIQIPLRSSGNNPILEEISDSPLFESSSQGFSLQAEETHHGTQICLKDDNLSSVRCLNIAGKNEKESIDEYNRRAAWEFVQALLRPQVSLSQVDLTSLNGAPRRMDLKNSTNELLGTEKKPGNWEE